MFSMFRTLLVAGAALPLVTGVALAQSAAPTTANPPAATATAPAATASTSVAGKTAKEPGALKTTPAEKKASKEKTTAVSPSGKTGAVKTAAIAPKHHAVKHTTPQTGPKANDATATKKL